ncbi:hypothetical protein ACLVTO_10665, partial [Streptococcus pneumoniae]
RNHPGSKLRQGFWMVFRLGVHNWGFYILNRGNGDIGRDLFLQLLFLVFLFKSIFYFTRQKRRFIE